MSAFLAPKGGTPKSFQQLEEGAEAKSTDSKCVFSRCFEGTVQKFASLAPERAAPQDLFE